MKNPRKLSLKFPEPMIEAIEQARADVPEGKRPKSFGRVVRAACFDYLKRKGYIKGRIKQEDWKDGREKLNPAG